MNALIVYYSNTGSNKYLAEQVAKRLNAPLEPIRPRFRNVPLLMISSLLGLGSAIHPFKHDTENIGKLIICGPIWMGTLIAPVRQVIKKYRDRVDHIEFITCCGSREEERDGKYGFNTVFAKAREVASGQLTYTEAFPINLVLPDELKDDADAIMKTRLNDENFKGEIVEQLEAYVARFEPELVD